jgi:hypothetical protein
MDVSPCDADYAGGAWDLSKGAPFSAQSVFLSQMHTCFNYYNANGTFNWTAVTTPIFPNQTSVHAELVLAIVVDVLRQFEF